MISFNLNQVFYYILIAKTQQPYFLFDCLNWHFCFTYFLFGLTASPKIFTKILQPVMMIFKKQGIWIVTYLDDLLLMTKTKKEALYHATIIINTLQNLEFSINKEKSSLIPLQIADYLNV